MSRFLIVQPSSAGSKLARLGHIALGSRPAIPTPHYAAVTSRGVIPHISPDLLEKHTHVSAVYLGLEDFIEKSNINAPILKSTATPSTHDVSPLSAFTGLPPRILTLLGPRRVPRIQCTAQSTNDAVAICTSVGFRTLRLDEYNAAVQTLRPNAAAGLADISDAEKVSLKREEKMVDRTHAWLRDTIEEPQEERVPLLATVLPLEAEKQQLYLADLGKEYEHELAGLVTHDAQSVTILGGELADLPRFCVDDPRTPHDLLDAVAVGNDIITTPFVTAVTEGGIAFSFTFPAPGPGIRGERKPLGVDMWSTLHTTAIEPLSLDCRCYTCTRHQRAYLHHLLQAKEMLAWTLLQIHNFHTLDNFFAGVRASIEAGTFEAEVSKFKGCYEEDFMVGEGKDRGPRMRGYQMKSVGRGEDKKREKVWGRFEESKATSGTQSPSAVGFENDQARKVDEAVESGAGVLDAQTTAEQLERLGMAEKAGEQKPTS